MKRKRFTFKQTALRVGDNILVSFAEKHQVLTSEWIAVLDYNRRQRRLTVLLPYHLGRLGTDRQWNIGSSDVVSIEAVIPAVRAVPNHSGEGAPFQLGDRVSFPYRFGTFRGIVIAALHGTVAVRNDLGTILHGSGRSFTRPTESAAVPA